MTDETIKITSAGEIQIDEVSLIANVQGGGGTEIREVDLRRVFAEINLYEDIFSNSLYGNILISDSNNLIEDFSIFGLEGLRIDVRTPGLSDKQRIRKTFGIYAITEQETIHNDRLQIYRLHFCSLELLSDAFTKPLNRPIPASNDSVTPSAADLVPFLFNTYVTKTGANAIPRNLVVRQGSGTTKEGVSDLVLGYAPYDYLELEKGRYPNVYNGEDYATSNKIKFIAPNWTPMKCINWICNRAVPNEKGKGGTFLFFESNKAFHFATIDSLINFSHLDKFQYEYTPPNLQAATDDSDTYSLDVAKQLNRVLKFEFNSAFNILDQQNKGYFGQEIRSIDPIMKRYREHQYSHDDHYDDFKHTSSDGKMFPNSPDFLIGSKDAVIDPRRHVVRRFRQPYFLFDDEISPLANHKQWLAQRAARLSSLTNFSINLLVYGRTDIRVGSMITFLYPNMQAKKVTDEGTDIYLTGAYLVTAIKHYISPIQHKMTLEAMKDAFNVKVPDTESTSPDLSYPTLNP